ncbi:MAG: hypothetical protein HWE07_09610 [Cytophagia bacterium]|nr:hypothetical protein [Cytophagia bacterium]
MKNTRFTTLLIFLLFSVSMKGQSQEEAIKKDIKTYFDLLQEEKISEALDWVHPDLIGMIGKEMFLAQYKEMLKQASFGAMEIKTVSEVYSTEEKGDFALVNYKFAMDYDVSTMEDQAKQIFLSSLKSQFGDATIEDNVVKVQADREMFAVARADYEGWRILDYDKGMKMILSSFVPEEVFTHFNK